MSGTTRRKFRQPVQKLPEKSEHVICQEILDYCDKRHIPIFRNQVGVARYGERRVPFGEKGMADYTLLLFVRNLPIHVFLEVKKLSGDQSEDQKAFQQWCIEHKIIYLLVRSVEELDQEIAHCFDTFQQILQR